jgi:hypothetical protein
MQNFYYIFFINKLNSITFDVNINWFSELIYGAIEYIF